MLALATVETAPAGGAAALEVLLGTLVSCGVMAAVLALGLAHRAGRTQILDRAAAPLTRVFALPGWALLPIAIAIPAFISAGFGFVWDVSIHIDDGRDESPFGTPGHYFMLAGIYGFIAAGFIALAMPRGEPRASWVRVVRGWHAPVAAVVMLGAGYFSALGFPLDDVWHRLFGQDVTLWGPTHQMMICGGVLNFIGLMMLVREGRAAMREERAALGLERPAADRGRRRARRKIQTTGTIGAAIVLTALTIAWQQEFAYGVPQFRLLFQPLLIVLSAALVLVAARLALGPGAALAATLVSAAITGALTFVVGPVLDSSVHHFPLYIAEALAVEAVGLTALRRSPYRFAAAAGVAVATLGVLAEWGWSHLWMPLAWPEHLVPEAIVRSLPVGVTAAVIGAWVASGFALPARAPITRPRGWVAPAAALAVLVASLAALIPTTPPGSAVTVALRELSPSPGRTVEATVRFADPADARQVDWLHALAWQGKVAKHVVNPLREVGPGVYRTTEPIPVDGTWKSAIRIARGGEMGGLPLYAPADRAIPAPAVTRPARFSERVEADRQFLQRERRDEVPGWLFALASTIVAALVVAMVVAFGWALQRIATVQASPTARTPSGSRPSASAAGGRRPGTS